MNDILETFFGHGREAEGLNALQTACRAFVMFFIALLLIRIAGMRVFGQKSAFDTVLVIMLGAILSRAVTGASPFIPTTAAGIVLALVHRLLAIGSVFSRTIGYVVKGRRTILFKNNKFEKTNMLLCSISRRDLMEVVRLQLKESTLENVKEIYMERSGRISVIKKQANK